MTWSLLQLRHEVKRLREENAALRAQNESMRSGMRRCVTCTYRLDYKQRRGSAPILAGADLAEGTGSVDT